MGFWVKSSVFNHIFPFIGFQHFICFFPLRWLHSSASLIHTGMSLLLPGLRVTALNVKLNALSFGCVSCKVGYLPGCCVIAAVWEWLGIFWLFGASNISGKTKMFWTNLSLSIHPADYDACRAATFLAWLVVCTLQSELCTLFSVHCCGVRSNHRWHICIDGSNHLACYFLYWSPHTMDLRDTQTHVTNSSICDLMSKNLWILIFGSSLLSIKHPPTLSQNIGLNWGTCKMLQWLENSVVSFQ